jgi:hypothetical protein
MGWSTPPTSRLPPGKETWYPLYRRVDGPEGRSGWVRKISPLPGFGTEKIREQVIENRYNIIIIIIITTAQQPYMGLGLLFPRLRGMFCAFAAVRDRLTGRK